MKKILTIIGARPQIIKAAAISRAIQSKFSTDFQEILVHTGQHYDENMSDVFFNELQIPKPNYNLNVGSGSHGAQTAKMIEGIEEILQKEKPDFVCIYGDTNSTLAGAIAASKIHIPIVHIEAGLRSFNKKMPEEINRITADHCATFLFCPTETAVENLKNENFKNNTEKAINIDNPWVENVGDVMYDNSMFFADLAEKKSQILQKLNVKSNDFVLVTIHRNDNTDEAEKLSSILQALLHIAENSDKKIILPLHPRTKKQFTELPETAWKNEFINHNNIMIINPLSFLDMILLEKNCYCIITDSGGVQKESYFFKKPCIVLRNETEWIELIENNVAILCGSDQEKIKNAFYNFVPNITEINFQNTIYGNAKAAERILETIKK